MAQEQKVTAILREILFAEHLLSPEELEAIFARNCDTPEEMEEILEYMFEEDLIDWETIQ